MTKLVYKGSGSINFVGIGIGLTTGDIFSVPSHLAAAYLSRADVELAPEPKSETEPVVEKPLAKAKKSEADVA